MTLVIFVAPIFSPAASQMIEATYDTASGRNATTPSSDDDSRANLLSTIESQTTRLCHAVDVVSVLPPQGALSILAKLPENDRPILWAAISLRATHLLSGDFKAFGRFYGQTIEGVAIMPPAAYLKGHRG